MPFDAGGNFTRVRNWKQDRDNGIRILADRHDEEDDNFAGGFNLAFLRTGTVPMTGNLTMGGNNIKNIKAGGPASPSITFELSNTTGFYQVNPNAIGVSSGGVKVGEFNGTGLSLDGALTIGGTITANGGVTFNGAVGVVSNLTVNGNTVLGPTTGGVAGIVALETDGSYGFLAFRKAGVQYGQIVGVTAGTGSLLMDFDGIQWRTGNGSAGLMNLNGSTGELNVTGSVVGAGIISGLPADKVNYRLGIYGRSPSGGTVDWDFTTKDVTYGTRTSMTITSPGRIGIGVGMTSPQCTLHVLDQLKIGTTGGSDLYLGFGAAGQGALTYIQGAAIKTNFFYHGPTAAHYFDTDLLVNRTSGGGELMRVSASGILTSMVLQARGNIQVNPPSGASKIDFTTPTAYWTVACPGTGNTFTVTDTQFSGEYLRLTGGGVGILTGGNNPAARLDVNSTAPNGIPGFRNYSNNGGFGPQSLQGFQVYNNLSSGSVDTTLVYGNTVNSYLAIGHHNGTTYIERMRITAAGTIQNSVSGGQFWYDGTGIASAKVTQGTAAPSGGADGDIYLQYV